MAVLLLLLMVMMVMTWCGEVTVRLLLTTVYEYILSYEERDASWVERPTWLISTLVLFLNLNTTPTLAWKFRVSGVGGDGSLRGGGSLVLGSAVDALVVPFHRRRRPASAAAAAEEKTKEEQPLAYCF